MKFADKKDCNFFTHYQLCQIIRKMGYRCTLPKHIPADTNWSGVIRQTIRELRLLSSHHFLHYLKLKSDLDYAARVNAQRELSDKKTPELVLMKLWRTSRKNSLPRPVRLTDAPFGIVLAGYSSYCRHRPRDGVFRYYCFALFTNVISDLLLHINV